MFKSSFLPNKQSRTEGTNGLNVCEGTTLDLLNIVTETLGLNHEKKLKKKETKFQRQLRFFLNNKYQKHY
jgi:hypothetical protein